MYFATPPPPHPLPWRHALPKTYITRFGNRAVGIRAGHGSGKCRAPARLGSPAPRHAAGSASPPPLR